MGPQQRLREVIEREVFVPKERERIVNPNGTDANWMFDFRRVLLETSVLRDIGELFWEKCEDIYPFQIGGIEVAAIPLVTALTLMVGEKQGSANGFFIRKSRKRSGLLHMIEGKITDERIVLVDDTINTGKSFIRQVEVIEALGKKVDAVFAVLRYRDESYYEYFHTRGIRVLSLFELNDFIGALPVANLISRDEQPVPMPFTVDWYWKAEDPDLASVIPKSAPVLDGERIYFGTDNGSFWALNQSDGSTAWEHKTHTRSKRRAIFSTPVLSHDTLYVGANDGNVYALDKHTGKERWVSMEADWIRSSPCMADDLGLVYVGAEQGLWNKSGALIALDAKTGDTRWLYALPKPNYSSPAYSKKLGIVVTGCDDGALYALNAADGSHLWRYETGGEIRGTPAIDEKRGLVCCGANDYAFYILNAKTGELVHKKDVGAWVYSAPLIDENRIYVSSLDKNLYAIDLDTGATVWQYATRGRIFASPMKIGESIYIGSNDGRLYELDAKTGKNTAFFQSVERITNQIAYNPATKRLFLPTFANEIYCLTR